LSRIEITKSRKIKNKVGRRRKSMKIRFFLGVIVVLAMICAISSVAVAKEGPVKDYNVVVVQAFKVPSGGPAPSTSGAQTAEALVYQIGRYSQKYSLFDMVIKEGTAEVPAGKKVLLIKGEVREYTRPSVGKQFGRSFIPGSEFNFSGTAAFAAHYQFVDKETGKVIYETPLRNTSIRQEDTVSYAMQRNAEAAAKLIYTYKVGR
jgi:hypothetical protein